MLQSEYVSERGGEFKRSFTVKNDEISYDVLMSTGQFDFVTL